MEAILSQLLEPDNEIIKAATAQLRTAFKQPGVIPELCTVLRQDNVHEMPSLLSINLMIHFSGSQKVQIRQYAAVLLRKKFSKSGSWLKFSLSDRAQLKAGCLSCLMTEPERSVRLAVAQLVATLARHELRGQKDGGWPELFTFILERLDSQNGQERVMGIMMLRLVHA